MQFHLIRSLKSAWGSALVTGLTMLWVGVVWRGILVQKPQEHRDIAGAVRWATETIALGLPYDFKSALGLRLAFAADYLNPISLVQYVVGRENALWASFVVGIPIVAIALSLLAQSAALPSSTARIAMVFVAVLAIVPSSLRVAAPEFGGAGFLLLYAAVPLIWAVLRNLRNAAGVGLGAFDFAAQAIFVWGVSATGIAQPAFVWLVALLAVSEALQLALASGLRLAARMLIRVVVHGFVAIFTSAMLLGSPVLTVLSAANAREQSFRGVVPEFEPLLIWDELGTGTAMRLVVLLLVAASLVALWCTANHKQRDFARVTVLVTGVLMVYSLLFALLYRWIEIGPRPSYLASWIVTPTIGLLLGFLTVSSIQLGVRKIRVGEFSGRSREAVLTASILLPVVALGAFAIKNPTMASAGLRPWSIIELPEVLTEDPLFEGVNSGRVLVVDQGGLLLGRGLQPGEVFDLTHNRQRPGGVVLLTAHMHSLTRWQHSLFDEHDSGTAKNLALYFFAREFDFKTAQLLGATHVVVGSPLSLDGVKLVRSDVSASGVIRYLYRLAPATTVPLDTTIHVQYESDIDAATKRTLLGDLNTPSVVFVDQPPRKLVSPQRADYRVEDDRILLDLNSVGESALVLPIEFSACHFVSRQLGSEGVAETMPLNGRFLGVVFSGTFKGEVRFRRFGPSGLACQVEDFLQTRHVG